MKELEIVTNINFDKQDIVTVAMAKIEALVRKNVRDFKAKRNNLIKEIEEANKMIVSYGEKNPPKEITKKLAQIEKAFKAAGISKTVGSRIRFRLTNKNDYELQIARKDESSDFTNETIGLTYKSVPYSSTQNSLTKKIETMEEQKEKAISDGVAWKEKLSDMSAVERQMRAKVVEAELNKTAEGKALIDVLTKNYEDTLKLIEM